MEEFQEADVLWPDAHQPHRADGCHRHHRLDEADLHQQPRTKAHGVHQRQSAPMRIPAAPPAEAVSTSRHSWACSYDDIVDECGDDDGVVLTRASGEAIVPPHVLAARRCAAERRVASSVCVGHGRTLKGRDLRAVRNAVLHMTGFLGTSDEY